MGFTDEQENNKEHFQAKVKTVGESSFVGCTSYPERKGTVTHNTTTGISHGVCARCGNYSRNLSDMGHCPICEAWFDKNSSPNGQNKYIKAGKREYLGL